MKKKMLTGSLALLLLAGVTAPAFAQQSDSFLVRASLDDHEATAGSIFDHSFPGSSGGGQVEVSSTTLYLDWQYNSDLNTYRCFVGEECYIPHQDLWDELESLPEDIRTAELTLTGRAFTAEALSFANKEGRADPKSLIENADKLLALYPEDYEDERSIKNDLGRAKAVWLSSRTKELKSNNELAYHETNSGLVTPIEKIENSKMIIKAPLSLGTITKNGKRLYLPEKVDANSYYSYFADSGEEEQIGEFRINLNEFEEEGVEMDYPIELNNFEDLSGFKASNLMELAVEAELKYKVPGATKIQKVYIVNSMIEL